MTTNNINKGEIIKFIGTQTYSTAIGNDKINGAIYFTNDTNSSIIVNGKVYGTTNSDLMSSPTEGALKEYIDNATANHEHSDYATKSYVTEKINEASISGGSSLNVTDFNDDSEIYNLLVAPVGSEYTTIGSLNNGEPWYSYLYAILNKNGEATLATSYMVVDKNMSVGNNFTAKYIQCETADIPHEHSNYATTGHSHDYVATAGSAQTADYAETAQYAATAGQAHGATHAVSADSAETADYAETTYHSEWADYAFETKKWKNSATIQIGDKTSVINANYDINFTLDEIGAASTSHEHSDYATTSYLTSLYQKINQLYTYLGLD